jgi:hypothetical protein
MKPGDIVEIHNATLGGKEIIEGKARLIKPSDIGNDGLNEGWEYWQVEFTDQPGEYFDRVIEA